MIDRNARKNLLFLKAHDLLKCHTDIVGEVQIFNM